MRTVARILAGLAGGLILLIYFSGFFIGSHDRWNLGFSLAGALAFPLMLASNEGRPKWYKTIGMAVVGGTASGVLYSQTVSPSPPMSAASGFGAGVGLSTGIALVLLVYGIAGRRTATRGADA